jgi:hypothetical protein
MHHIALTFDGGALILMLVAGFNFSRFHLDNFLIGKMRPAFANIFREILLPYWMVLGLFNLVIFWRFGEFPVSWVKFFLIGNYYNQLDWMPFPTWFVQVLVQTIVVLALPLMVPPLRRQAQKHLPVFLGTLLLGSIFYRLIDQFYLMARFPTWFADQRTAWEAWIFIFGLVLYRLKSDRDRKIASIGLVLLTLLFWYGDGSRIVMLILAGMLLIWRSHLPIPKLAIGPIKELGASSMYIYMTHLTGIQSFVPYGPIAHVLVGLLQGIFFRHLWLQLIKITLALWPFSRTKRLQAIKD